MWRAGGERTAFCVSLISSKIQRLLFAIKWKTEMQGQARNDRSLVVRRRAAIRPILVSFRCAQMMTRCPDRLPNLPSEQLAITLAIRSTKPTIRERARQGNSCAAAPFVPRPSFSNSTPLLKTHHPRYVLLTSADSSLHFCLSGCYRRAAKRSSGWISGGRDVQTFVLVASTWRVCGPCGPLEAAPLPFDSSDTSPRLTCVGRSPNATGHRIGHGTGRFTLGLRVRF